MVKVLILCCLLLAGPAHAGTPSSDIMPNLSVVGWDRLATHRQRQLTDLLSVFPRGWYPWLRVITVDSAPLPESMTSEVCAPKGVFAYGGGPCRFNIWSNPPGWENPFPADAPETAQVEGFVIVAIHELAHQFGHGVLVDRYGGLRQWQDRLLSDAGTNAQHYLRSMFDNGFFATYPQEFVASMLNQWGTCSVCTLRLALTRWDQGNPHPLNQAIFLMALSGMRTALLDDNWIGTVIAYDMRDGLPQPEMWNVTPWACGGSLLVQGRGWHVLLETDQGCRVTAVRERSGF